jgi:hypothetical protein
MPYLLLAAVTAAFVTQVRAEGLLLLAAPLGMLLIRAVTTRAWMAFGVYAGIVIALFLPWAIASRIVTAPEGRLLSSGSLAGLIHNYATLPHVLFMNAFWMVRPKNLGPFVILVPLAVGIIIGRWRQVFRDWTTAWLPLTAAWLPIPYLGFFTALPEALHIDAMGRYLSPFLVLVSLFVASQLIAMSRGFRRLVLAVGGVGLAIWLIVDGLGWIGFSFYHLRPVESARPVLAHAEVLAALTPVQQLQWQEQSQQRMGFAAMLPTLVSSPLPSGDVILFVAPGSPEGIPGSSYVHSRLMYLLYPHRIDVTDDPAMLERALASSTTAALIVYAHTLNLDHIQGEVAFTFDRGRYLVIRSPRLKQG